MIVFFVGYSIQHFKSFHVDKHLTYLAHQSVLWFLESFFKRCRLHRDFFYGGQSRSRTYGVSNVVDLQSTPIASRVIYPFGAAHRIRTCKPFTAQCVQDTFLTTRTCSILLVASTGIEPVTHPYQGCVLTI